MTKYFPTSDSPHATPTRFDIVLRVTVPDVLSDTKGNITD